MMCKRPGSRSDQGASHDARGEGTPGACGVAVRPGWPAQPGRGGQGKTAHPRSVACGVTYIHFYGSRTAAILFELENHLASGSQVKPRSVLLFRHTFRAFDGSARDPRALPRLSAPTNACVPSSPRRALFFRWPCPAWAKCSLENRLLDRQTKLVSTIGSRRRWRGATRVSRRGTTTPPSRGPPSRSPRRAPRCAVSRARSLAQGLCLLPRRAGLGLWSVSLGGAVRTGMFQAWTWRRKSASC